MPFAVDAETPASAPAVEFRPAGQMSEADRNLEADAEASIAEHAGFAGLEFNQGKWSYIQVACPALPNHLFLRFMRNNGEHDISVFTAAIPRSGQGRVRILPILRRSYSLFSPAPINALTLAAFNHIRTEEPSGVTADWLGTGLCYAALAGANPELPTPADFVAPQRFTPALLAALSLEEKGNAVLQFTDVSSPRNPRQWTLVFNSHGKLLKARHSAAPLLRVRQIHPPPVPQAAAAGASATGPASTPAR